MESYNAHINQNAYNPETRVIEKAQEVKVGQWWEWESCGVCFFVESKRDDGFFKCTESNVSYYRTPDLIQDLARLIMCPSWPIEVGDRFEAERHFQSNGQEWKTETVVCRVIYIDNNSTALVESESDYYNEEDILTLESLGKMRRLPRESSMSPDESMKSQGESVRSDKAEQLRNEAKRISDGIRDPKNNNKTVWISYGETACDALDRMAEPDHVRDATEKVEPPTGTDCPICGVKNTDNWPVTLAGEIHEGGCQMCWEKESSESWWNMVSEMSPDPDHAPAIIYAADYEPSVVRKLADLNLYQTTFNDHEYLVHTKKNKTLILGNPEPVKAMAKRIAKLEAKLHERPKVASQYQLKRTVKILDLGTKVYELTARIISLGNETADLRGERDSAIRRALHAENRVSRRDATIGHLNNRIMKLTNAKVSNPSTDLRGREMKKSNLHYILTVEEIKEKGPCKEGYEWVLANAVDGKIDRAAILGHRKDWEHWITENRLCSPVVSSGGHRSTVTGGYRSTVSGGDRSTVSGGDQSTVSGGHRSTVSGGDRSTVSGGDQSTVSGGHRSTVTGGYRSTVSGGDRSTVSGGDRSVLMLHYWNDNHFEYQVAVVGKDGIKPETKYKLDDNNQFAEAADEQ